jgi:hypothetical protein
MFGTLFAVVASAAVNPERREAVPPKFVAPRFEAINVVTSMPVACAFAASMDGHPDRAEAIVQLEPSRDGNSYALLFYSTTIIVGPGIGRRSDFDKREDALRFYDSLFADFDEKGIVQIGDKWVVWQVKFLR